MKLAPWTRVLANTSKMGNCRSMYSTLKVYKRKL
ncbi:hypothetical protein MUK42_34950 [Musa troglodytarum]|uniref:Uncharacterized protein n=1 Tax=Musa troglodytarum TaxID=320322 RepID=A0A9E7K225_9LILI|nr:hypothetical protein MUK42_34950 [Musa troglodytarum]